MLVTTHYPQVSTATSNVATEAARTDNQHRPVIQPIKTLTKSHSERKLNKQEEQKKKLNRENHSQKDNYGQNSSTLIGYLSPIKQKKLPQNIFTHQSGYRKAEFKANQQLFPIDKAIMFYQIQTQHFKQVRKNIFHHYNQRFSTFQLSTLA